MNCPDNALVGAKGTTAEERARWGFPLFLLFIAPAALPMRIISDAKKEKVRQKKKYKRKKKKKSGREGTFIPFRRIGIRIVHGGRRSQPSKLIHFIVVIIVIGRRWRWFNIITRRWGRRKGSREHGRVIRVLLHDVKLVLFLMMIIPAPRYLSALNRNE